MLHAPWFSPILQNQACACSTLASELSLRRRVPANTSSNSYRNVRTIWPNDLLSLYNSPSRQMHIPGGSRKVIGTYGPRQRPISVSVTASYKEVHIAICARLLWLTLPYGCGTKYIYVIYLSIFDNRVMTTFRTLYSASSSLVFCCWFTFEFSIWGPLDSRPLFRLERSPSMFAL